MKSPVIPSVAGLFLFSLGHAIVLVDVFTNRDKSKLTPPPLVAIWGFGLVFLILKLLLCLQVLVSK